MTTRLWGEWEPRFYGSGTTIVAIRSAEHRPHLYVYADSAINESRYMRDRYEMCHQLAAYMNGGDRPAWLDDFERITENCSRSLAGGSIDAVGPMVDCDPPNLNWVWDDRDESKSDRAKLLDAVFFKEAGK